MAASNGYFAKPNHRFFSSTVRHHHFVAADDPFELDESDLYNYPVSTHSNSPELRSKSLFSHRFRNKTQSAAAAANKIKRSDLSASLPVNVLNWSNILGDKYRRNIETGTSHGDEYNYDGELDGGVMIPPHEYLARKRIDSFSVQEGIRRTLKGRDLSRVRNAIWEKTVRIG